MKLLTLFLCSLPALACTAPTNLAAVAKGPTQINLTWTAASVACYGYNGYIVEVQSAGDSRYSSYTEFQPIPTTPTTFACDPSVIINTRSCTISDATGFAVYNPLINSVPPWVVEAQYIDPQDGTPAQYIVNGLKPGIAYSFRVRVHSGLPPNTVTYSSYSATASATTLTPAHTYYVSPSGSNGNPGSSGSPWQTLLFGAAQLLCGDMLYVLGGTYGLGDRIVVNRTCTNTTKLVIALNPGDTMRFPIDGNQIYVSLSGAYITIDGVETNYAGTWNPGGGIYPWTIDAVHSALLGIKFSVDVIPSVTYGVWFRNGDDGLLAHSAIKDVGTPDTHDDGSGTSSQSPDGATGFPVRMGIRTVVRENHITRGEHDTGLCLGSICQSFRYLGNVADGGWGTGICGGTFLNSGFGLVEGNIFRRPGYFETDLVTGNSFKDCIQLSGNGTTARRNICDRPTKRWFEISAEGTNGVDTAADNKFYNNSTRGDPTKSVVPVFVSANFGVSAYSGTILANNIFKDFYCDNVPPNGHNVFATEIYLAVTGIRNNSFTVAGGDNTTCNSGRIIYWDSNVNMTQYTIASIEGGSPANGPAAWSGNTALQVDPQYVDPDHMDYRLASGSPLIGAGVHVTDALWTNPSTAASPDLGAYGLVPPTATPTGGASVSSATRVSSRTSH
jgi:hypothetical protein